MTTTQTSKRWISALFSCAVALLICCGGSSNSSTSRPCTPPPLPLLPIGLYTDLQSAPVGAYVTVYSIGTGTSSWPIVLQTGDKTVVQVSNATTPLTLNGQSIPVSVHTGRVITVTPVTMAAAVQSLLPGDTIYLRAGTYSGKYDNENWNESNFVLFKSGTAAQPIAFVAYPGETVTISNSESAGRPNFCLGDGNGRMASYLTIAGLNLVAPYENIWGGGYTADSSRPEAGATHVRMVRNTFTLTNNTANTHTGMVALQGDGWKVLGNTFINSLSRTIYNTNHALYIQNGADNVEVAYNLLAYLRMGHVIQVHQDGTPMLYTNIRIHDNMLAAADNGDMRGITVSNVDNASTVTIENNTLNNLGQDFSGIAVYRGIVTIRNNMTYNIKAPVILLQGQLLGSTRAVTASGNSFSTVNGYPAVAAESGASLSEITLLGNGYCGSATVLP